MGKYCGDSIPPSHVSSSHEILIHFQSDSAYTVAGFKMEYNPIGNISIQNNTEYYWDRYKKMLSTLFLDEFSYTYIELIKIAFHSIFLIQIVTVANGTCKLTKVFKCVM